MSADIGFTDANTTKANCSKHGIVSGDFFCYATHDPSYKTPKICPKCFVDFIAANVTPTEPLPPASRSLSTTSEFGET